MSRSSVCLATFPWLSHDPLHSAVRAGDIDQCLTLIREGVNIQTVDGRNQTALHIAVLYGHDAILEILLATKQIDINAISRTGRTALYEAIERGSIFAISLLLEQGAKIDLVGKDLSGKYIQPLIFSVINKIGSNIINIVRLLLEKGADMTARHEDKTLLDHVFCLTDVNHKNALIQIILQHHFKNLTLQNLNEKRVTLKVQSINEMDLHLAIDDYLVKTCLDKHYQADGKDILAQLLEQPMYPRCLEANSLWLVGHKLRREKLINSAMQTLDASKEPRSILTS